MERLSQNESQQNVISSTQAAFLMPTEFCPCQDQKIKDLAQLLTQNAWDESEAASLIFHWVRDRLLYRLGLYQHTALETIAYKGGSCSNKANVMVALLRSLGIPAGYHVSVVKTREYFGPYCVPRFNQFMSYRSYHVYVGVFLNGRWVACDPTDDYQLTNGTQHIAPQARPVSFDGKKDALLNLDPSHILQESERCLPSIDEIFCKKPRIPQLALDVINLYVDFMRTDGIKHSEVSTFVDAFFDWFSKTHPQMYKAFLDLEQWWQANQQDKKRLENHV